MFSVTLFYYDELTGRWFMLSQSPLQKYMKEYKSAT